MKKILKGIVCSVTMLFALPVIASATYTPTEDVTLQNDLNEAIVIEEGKNITINLNGHNITVTDEDAISNHGTLIIKGSGNVKSNKGVIVNYPGATATLDNGSYLSTGWYTIKNMGVMTINNMNFINEVNNGSSLVANGFYGNLNTDRQQKYSGKEVKLTINGGTFENKMKSCNVIKNDDYGTLIINGGTFISNSSMSDNGNPVVQNWNKATINGGTFTSNNGVAIANGALDQVADIGELTINGGTFTGTKGLFGTNGAAKKDLGVLTINDGIFNGDATVSTLYEIIINGGTFDNKVAANEEDGYDTYKDLDSDKYVVAKEEELTNSVSRNLIKEADVDSAELALIKKALDGKTIAAFYNIDLFKTVDGIKVDQVIEADGEVVVTLSIPTDLEAVKDGYTRTYYIVRVHDGKTDILDVTDNGDGTISFKTDKFSTYALAYNDTKTASTTKAANTNAIKNPKTLDKALIYTTIFMVSAIAFYLSFRYVKKKLESE